MTTIKRIIGGFLTDRMVDLNADQSGLVITICKYDDYNPLQDFGGPVRGPVGGRLVDPQEKRKEKRVQVRTSELRPDLSTEDRIAQMPKEAIEIVKNRWLPFAELKASSRSPTAKLRILDTLRLLHERDGYCWDDVGKIVEYAAKHWHPAHIGSPASLREWTDRKDRRRHEAIMDQIRGGSSDPVAHAVAEMDAKVAERRQRGEL